MCGATTGSLITYLKWSWSAATKQLLTGLENFKVDMKNEWTRLLSKKIDECLTALHDKKQGILGQLEEALHQLETESLKPASNIQQTFHDIKLQVNEKLSE